MKKNIVILVAFILNLQFINSQSIGGIVNQYLQVDSIYNDTISYVNSAEIDSFKTGDKVLLIQHTGDSLFQLGAYLTISARGSRSSIKNTGKYEFLVINGINTTNKFIVFTRSLKNSYTTGEKIQLIKIYEGNNITVNSQLNAKKWDGFTGGIVALLATDTITLEDNINVGYMGFRGATAESDYTGGCRQDVNGSTLDTLYFLPSDINKAGDKGEGTVSTIWPYTKGAAFASSGGGGGNGKYSGGAGGSNYGAGGDGGLQFEDCTNTLVKAQGGIAGDDYYNDVVSKRVVFGGGGGAGVENSDSSRIATDGGDGGGIAILITKVLITNNNNFTAQGESITDNATASGAGGGAGGSVLIDANNIVGNVNIDVSGGDGSNTLSNCTGSGGGGGGGVVWFSLSNQPAGVIDTSGGSAGSVDFDCSIHVGSSGNPGKILTDLILPLNGFLFNNIYGTDTICAGQTPGKITASYPKGGDGNYTYQWLESTNKTNWTTASGTGNLTEFNPSSLDVTTYFLRVVSSSGQIDTSTWIEIFVYPSITNNSITGSDTICYADAPNNITGTSPSGGDDANYLYQWQLSTNLSSWQNIGGSSSSNNPLNPGSLTQDSYYRRYVTSTSYCSDYSDTVTITVLPSITNNSFITSDTVICMNSSPGRLYALQPQYGDEIYTFKWISSSDQSNWSIIPESDSLNKLIGILTDTTYFKRIVYSGSDNACIDTSDIKTVYTLNLISNNNVIGGSTQYTCYNTSKVLSGALPINGVSGDYGYLWEMSNNGSDWESASGTSDNNLQNFETLILTDSAFYRRIVYSSENIKECIDTSTAVKIRIHPLPGGDIVSSVDTVCVGEIIYIKFNITGSNSPWNVVVGNESISSTKSNITSSFDSVTIGLFNNQSIKLLKLEDKNSCLADTSLSNNTVEATVYENPVANAGINDEICGLEYMLTATQSLENSIGIWMADNAVFEEITNDTTDVAVSQYGTYTFFWQESNWECTDTDSINITFYEQPEMADAGEHQTLNFKFFTDLNALAPTVGTGTWSVSQGTGIFGNDTLFNTTVREISYEDENIYKWTITNGVCPPVSDSISVIINPLSIPKGFTPNGDNKNDVFKISIENLESFELIVFDRLGQLVYKSNLYSAEGIWDGKNDNEIELPEGTYFYILKAKVEGREEIWISKKYIEIIK